MKKNTVAYLIPTHNRANQLYGWFDTVYGSIRVPDQIVVVLDGCTDDSRISAEVWSKRMNVTIVTQPRCGPAAAIGAGFKHVDCDWVMLPADDDVILATGLNDLMRIGDAPDSVEEFACIAGRSLWFDDQNRVEWEFGQCMPTGKIHPFEAYRLAANGHLQVPTQSALWNVQMIRRNGALQPHLRWFYENYLLWTLVFQFKMFCVDDIITRFRLNPGGYYASDPEKQPAFEALLAAISAKGGTVAQRVRDSGVLGFLDGNLPKAYEECRNYRYNGQRLHRLFTRAVRRFAPGWLQRMGAKYYR